MKVLLLSTSLEGGAGGAAYRLHRGLQGLGLASQILIQSEQVNDEAVLSAPNTKLVRLVRGLGRLTANAKIDQLPLKLYPNRNSSSFSLQWMPDSIPARVAQLCPDVINLHWTCGGWMKIETVPKLDRPVVWTLHDMWPFTGGCHYSQNCDRYTNNCGACPQLCSTKDWDLSRWTWKRKAKAWKNLNLTVVTPSTWLAERARSSSLFRDLRIEVFPHGVDTKRYKPIDKCTARKIFDLPQDKLLVLFGAWNPKEHRKGFHLLAGALERLSKGGWKDKIEFVVFGFRQPRDMANFTIKTHFMGKLRDEISMALIYSAADVLVAPSTEEAFGLVIVESLSCGTPVVTFDATGPRDLVEHMRNGFLARAFDTAELSRGIGWVLEDGHRYQRLTHRAREKAEQEFTLEQNARRYQALFSEVVENRNVSANGHRAT